MHLISLIRDCDIVRLYLAIFSTESSISPIIFELRFLISALILRASSFCLFMTALAALISSSNDAYIISVYISVIFSIVFLYEFPAISFLLSGFLFFLCYFLHDNVSMFIPCLVLAL